MVWVIPDIDMKKHLLKLRYIGSLVIVAVAFPFFFLGGSTEASSYLMNAIWDCGHLVFFIAIVGIVSKRFDINSWRVALLITLAVFIGGGSIELIQAHIGRDGSWDDLLRDLTGAWLGIFLLQKNSIWSWIGRAVSVALLIPTLTTVIYEARFQLNINEQFPIIAGFESSIETYGHRSTALSDQFHTQGQYSLKVDLSTRDYTGIVFNRLINDWSAYKSFSFDIYNPDPQVFSMTVRVNDVDHQISGWASQDRFNRSFQLEPGWNHFSYSLEDIRNAPEHRKMDMTKIIWVEFFTRKLPAPRSVYFDNVRLD